MHDAASSVLTPWANFYITTGSAAAGLTGLMFVVITLVTDIERLRKNPDGISAFSTPTVVHFSAALYVSVILNAPWRHSLFWPAILLGLAGVYGLLYISRIIIVTKRLSEYRPDLEDWAFYSVIPLVAYGALLASALMLRSHPADALFVLAGGVVLLIFTGIRNAWDIVTYIATGRAEEPPQSS